MSLEYRASVPTTKIKNYEMRLGMLAHNFNPSRFNQEAEAGLVYRLTSRIATTVTERNPVSNHPPPQKNKTQTKQKQRTE